MAVLRIRNPVFFWSRDPKEVFSRSRIQPIFLRANNFFIFFIHLGHEMINHLKCATVTVWVNTCLWDSEKLPEKEKATNLFFYLLLFCLIRDPGRRKSGSRINIPDLQHWVPWLPSPKNLCSVLFFSSQVTMIVWYCQHSCKMPRAYCSVLSLYRRVWLRSTTTRCGQPESGCRGAGRVRSSPIRRKGTTLCQPKFPGWAREAGADLTSVGFRGLYFGPKTIFIPPPPNENYIFPPLGKCRFLSPFMAFLPHFFPVLHIFYPFTSPFPIFLLLFSFLSPFFLFFF